MSSLSERLITLEQDFKYAEASAVYKNICNCMQQIKNSNAANQYNDTRRNEQITNQMASLASWMACLKALAPITDRFEPTKCEEGELCLKDLLGRLQPMADAWRSKSYYLQAESKTQEWLSRFTGTATDALKTAWDRANGIKLM